MAAKKKKSDPNKKIAAENRKARYNFELSENVEAGLVLVGTEVKSLREGRANIADSYATFENGEPWLINSYLPEYLQGNQFNHEPRRRRKLLMKKREMKKYNDAIDRDGMTIVPLKIYFTDKGLAKIEIALGKGKKLHDKRASEKARDWNKQKAKVLRDRG